MQKPPDIICPISIANFVLCLRVLLENLKALLTVELGADIGRGFIKLLVTKAQLVGVGYGAAVIDPGDVRPHDRSPAHRTGLGCGVELAARKIKGVKVFTGVTDSHHLAVTGGVFHFHYPVMAFADNCAVPDYHTAKGAAVALAYTLTGFLDRHFHKPIHLNAPLSFIMS